MDKSEPSSASEAVGRPRKAGSRDLPLNLYYYRPRGVYRYRHPQTGKVHNMGANKATAVAAAHKLNDILMPASDLVAGVIAVDRRMSDVLEWFKTHELPTRNLAAKTLENYHSIIGQIDTRLGKQTARTLNLSHCAALLREYDDKPRRRNQIRGLLVDVCRCARAEGWMETNPAEATRKTPETRKRRRLDEATYAAIRTAAPAWLKATMDLDLALLARREDLVLLRFDTHIDGDVLKLDLLKSSKESAGERAPRMRLDVQIDDTLKRLIEECRDDVASPFIVHRRPGRQVARDLWPKWMKHWTQVSPDALTRAFNEAREKSGACAGMDNPPTFHELRSLGAARYRAAGMPEEHIKALLGHTDIKTTRIYLNGHEAPRISVSIAPDQG